MIFSLDYSSVKSYFSQLRESLIRAVIPKVGGTLLWGQKKDPGVEGCGQPAGGSGISEP